MLYSPPPQIMALFVAAASALALGGALIGQFGFGLHPCDLCIYQRIPFILNIGIGLIILTGLSKYLPVTAHSLIGLSGILFIANAGIAFFHSGVERKWWTGLTGCSTPDMSGSIEDLLKRIQETDVTRCDEIPWSLFGLSMANYNVVFCLGLGIICIAYIFRSLRPARS